jgi:hypothetical protein
VGAGLRPREASGGPSPPDPGSQPAMTPTTVHPGPVAAESKLPAPLLASLFLVVVPLLTGCGGGGAAGSPVTPADARQTAEAAEDLSRLDAPYSLFFEWSALEAGLRVRGQGVARVEPPHRARLDLFTTQGTRIAVAALVDDELRLPPGTPDILPPAALLWGALGVFRPGDDTSLSSGLRIGNDGTELRYRLPGEDELHYRLRDLRIEAVDLKRGGRALEELRLARTDGERFPREATYRDLVRVRELRITLERVEDALPFPSGIWNPVP